VAYHALLALAAFVQCAEAVDLARGARLAGLVVANAVSATVFLQAQIGAAVAVVGSFFAQAGHALGAAIIAFLVPFLLPVAADRRDRSADLIELVTLFIRSAATILGAVGAVFKGEVLTSSVSAEGLVTAVVGAPIPIPSVPIVALLAELLLPVSANGRADAALLRDTAVALFATAILDAGRARLPDDRFAHPITAQRFAFALKTDEILRARPPAGAVGRVGQVFARIADTRALTGRQISATHHNDEYP